MTYLPDTNAWIGFLNTNGSKIQQRLQAVDPSAIRLCSIVNDLILVTHNTREFSRVATLKIEDWE